MDDFVERRSHKRKEHGGEGYLDRSEKRSRMPDGVNEERRDKYRDSAERNKGYREDSVERRAHKSKEHRGEGYLDKSDKRSRTSDYVNEERRDKYRDSTERNEGYREDSVEKRAHKSKEHGGEGYLDRSEKRSRMPDGVNEERRDKYRDSRSRMLDGVNDERRDKYRDSAERNKGYREDSVERRVHKSKEHRGEGYVDKSDKRSRTSDYVNEERRDKYRDSAERTEGYREDSVERRAHKSKEHGGEGFLNKNEKRSRVSDGVNEERRDKGEKQRFKDQNEEDLNDAHTKSPSLAKLEKGGGGEERRDMGEKRNFEDRAKELSIDAESIPISSIKSEKPVLEEQLDAKPQLQNAESMITWNRSGSVPDGAAMKPPMASKDVLESSASSNRPTNTKVSLIPTTHENKGVSVTGSHEVRGKSSTDGTSSTAGKSGSLSLDALAKAKKALQIQKELAEKLKRIPQLNKSASLTSAGSGPVGLNTEAQKTEPSSMSTQTSSSMFDATAAPTLKPIAGGMPGLTGLTSVPNYEAVKRAQELAAKMGFHQDPEFAPLLNMFPGPMVADVSGQPKPAKAPVLRLDAQGREVDEHGNVINIPRLANLSTLKVNINKQKKEAFQILRPDLDADMESNPHFDSRMGIDKTKLLRPKRMTFQFVEEGKWSKQAEILQFKSQFGEAQAKELKTKQAQLAKAKAELDINPNLIEVSERIVTKEEKPKDPIPEIEWWDVALLPSGTYDDITEDNVNMKMDKITVYLEHPLPIEPPAEPAPPPPQPLKLTKKEQKKLRTQRRLAKEKDRQEMIRQGLLEPPKPKIKMSNLMKVLGAEATQDPTKLEMEIRSAAAEREQAHVDRNIARKLTPSERREKKERKLFEDPNTLETIVSVYKVNSLAHPQTRFKVDVNAQENRLTGCAVISDGFSVVIVEGGSKSVKRYGKLMLQRINWAASVLENEEEGEENGDQPVNKCVLVWQGSVAKSSFNKFLIHQCRTEAAARKVFSDAGVAHYWDLAVNYADDQI